MTMRRMPRPAAAVVLGVLAASLLTGCVWSGPPPATCVPELTVEPNVTYPGDTITVSTRRACAVEPPDGGWLVRVHPEGALTPGVESRVDPASDGSFAIALTLPYDMPAGTAVAEISDWWDVAECPDGASCASASGSFVVEER